MKTMVCSKCGIEKELTDFQKRPNSDKYYGTCKKCKNEYAKQYRIEKAEQISKQRKQHYKDNIEEMRKRGRKHYEENKELINERNKKYYEANSKALNQKSRDYYKEHSDEIKKQKKEYNKNHKAEQIKWRKQYYEENKDSIYEYQKKYREENSEKIKEYMETYRIENSEIIKEKRKQYYEENKELINERNKKYVQEHIEERRKYREKYRKDRFEKDPLFKITVNIRHLISNSLRKQGFTKKSRTYKILGCDYDTFYNHLLQTYKKNYGVDWDGKEEVHIDHIIPVSIANSEEEIIKLCHYTNLQLLKAKDNLNKKDKLDWNLNDKK